MSSTGSANNSCYEFEDFVLRPSERVLLRNGDPVPLKSKVFDTLLRLVQNHGKVLSKDDLMKLIWSDRFVEEGNLSQYIFILRRVLGENPQDHRFIVTIPGHGYRFVAKVREVPDAVNGGSNGHAATEPRRRIRSIAILPLRFLDPAQQDEFLGLALADTLITRLSSNKSISVRSTAAVVRYTDSGKDPILIGQEIKADAIMSGTIYRVRDLMAVNLQLTNVSTEEILWANRFEVNAREFLELQSEIAEEVANALAIELDPERPASPQMAPHDRGAYQKYLKARFHLEKRTEASLLEGLKSSEELVRLEPDFALAHVGVADSYLLLGKYLFLPPDGSFPLAKESAERAIGLEPRLAEAYSSLAEYHYYYTKDWARAHDNYQQSQRLNPNYALARHWYAWALMCRGEFAAASEQIDQAQSLDPSSMLLSTARGLPYYFDRDYRRAARQFESVLEIDGNQFSARFYLASALAQMGDTGAAIREFKMLLDEAPAQQVIAHLGFCYAESGRYEKARDQMDLLDEFELERYVSPYLRAIVHCGLGRAEQALSLLEEAHERNDPWLVLARVDPFLSCLYGEPRFTALLEKLGLC